MADEGIEIPIEIPTADAVVTIEKLAAKLLLLEDAVEKLGNKGRQAGENIATGFGQGLGQKVFDKALAAIQAIPRAFEEAISSSAEFGDHMVKLAAKTGFSTTQLQEMSLAARQSGFGIDGLARNAAVLNAKLASSPEAFDRLGISIVEFAKKEPGDKFNEVIEKLNGIKDPAEKASAAISLFGQRLGPQILPLAAALETTRKRSQELGLVWSDQMLKAAGQFTDVMEELSSAQSGFMNAIGSFISTSPEVQQALSAIATIIGNLTKKILEWHEAWERVSPATRKVILASIAVGAALIALIAVMAAFKIAASQMGKEVIKVAAEFGVQGVAITGFGSAVKVAMLTAKGAVIDFAVAAKTAMAGALGIVGAVIAGLVLGNELGKWLHENSELFRTITNAIGDFVAAIGDALGPVAKFLGLTSKIDRDKLEIGKKAFADATPEQLRSLALFKVQQDILKAQEKRKDVQKDTLADLVLNGEQQKKELQIVSQINAVYAARGGALASARQALASGLAIQQKTFDVEKANLLFQAQGDDLKLKAANKQISLSETLLGLQSTLAKAQFDAAVSQEAIRVGALRIDQSKQLLGLDQQIIAAGRENQTALEGIFQARADSVAAAQAEHDVTVSKLLNERELGRLTLERLEENEAAVEQANRIYDRQVALADATQKSALAARDYAFAVRFGTENTRLAKEGAEELAQVLVALRDPQALISDADVKAIDTAREKAVRLGHSFEEVAALAAEGFAAFQKNLSQGIDKAIEDIKTKLSRGLTPDSGAVQGLIKEADLIKNDAEQAERFAKALDAVNAARRKSSEDAGNTFLIDNQVIDMVGKLRDEKKHNDLLKDNLRLRVAAKTITQEEAEKLLPGVLTQQLGINNAIHLAVDFMNSLGISTDSVVGKMLNLVTATLQAADAGKAAKTALDSGNKSAAAAAALGTLSGIIGSAKSTGQGALSGAGRGAAFGAAFGPQGAIIGGIIGGLAGGIAGFFNGKKFKKISKEAGAILGKGMSEETIKAIEANAEKLGISVRKAALLSIGQAAEDSKKTVSSFASQIIDLEKAIADGSIPAAEGIAALGDNFSKVAEEAEKAGHVGDRVLTSIIKNARALKIDSPEIKAFVGEQLDSALEGVHKFVGAIGVLRKDWLDFLQTRVTEGLLSPDGFENAKKGIEDLGRVSGVVFGAMFDAIASERGIVAAVDALGEDFATLRETLTETLGIEQMEKILGPFGAAFDTIGNEHLRPIFEGIDGIGQAMKGLANAAFLNVDQFAAMQQATKGLFDQAIAGGADTRTALQAIAPQIQAAISAAEQFGVPLDASTQALKDLAEQNGIAFKTDPIDKLADAIDRLVKTLGGDVPDAIDKSIAAMEKLKDAAPDNIKVGGTGATGGTDGRARQSVNAFVTVNLGINENPLAQSDTAEAMRQQTIAWTAAAIEDRVPRLVAAMADSHVYV